MASKIKIFIKNCLACLLNFLPAKPNRAIILMYHSVGRNGKFFTVKPENFAAQLDYLQRRKCNVVPLAVLLAYLSAGKVPPRTVAITFDDGYEDNYSAAFPLLKKYNFPAAIFLATGLKTSDLPLLSKNQIAEMADSGLIDFEPHTVSHIKLTKVDATEARREITESKEFIERECGQAALYFAYPYGRYNEQVVVLVKETGFQAAVTVEKGAVSRNSDLFLLKRNAVDSAVSLIQFKAMIKFGKI